jgi:hypothetical protein
MHSCYYKTCAQTETNTPKRGSWGYGDISRGCEMKAKAGNAITCAIRSAKNTKIPPPLASTKALLLTYRHKFKHALLTSRSYNHIPLDPPAPRPHRAGVSRAATSPSLPSPRSAHRGGRPIKRRWDVEVTQHLRGEDGEGGVGLHAGARRTVCKHCAPRWAARRPFLGYPY